MEDGRGSTSPHAPTNMDVDNAAGQNEPKKEEVESTPTETPMPSTQLEPSVPPTTSPRTVMAPAPTVADEATPVVAGPDGRPGEARVPRNETALLALTGAAATDGTGGSGSGRGGGGGGSPLATARPAGGGAPPPGPPRPPPARP